MEIICEVKEGIHQPPGILVSSGWQKVVVCEDCTYTVGELTQINYYEPCPNCGGRFSGFKTYKGKWDKKSKTWIERLGVKK